MPTDPSFPLYRRYKNHHSYFRIDSPESFTELKRFPGGWKSFEFKVKILPDRNYIHDMIHDFELHWEEVEAEDFEKIKALIGDQ